MNTILGKRKLSADVFRMKINAPLIAEERKAGQFIILQVDKNYGERIPLTIANADAQEGFIEIIFQAVGATTKKLSRKKVGEKIETVLGPPSDSPLILKNSMPPSFV